GARVQSALARDGEDALDDPVLDELCDRRHGPSLGSNAAARVRLVARVRPFRAVRYDEANAGPLAGLVAPPYDVLDPEERAAYLARSPYNVVHLTLPDDEQNAARLWN